MEAFKIVETVLYLLSNLFFYPVIIALFFLLARICYNLGNFSKEYWLRSRTPGYFTIPFLQKIDAFDDTDIAIEIELHSVLEQAEQKGFLAIQSSRYSVKMGPTLGLIGTLTPMAKALSGLSTGNLNSLSTQMITAFSTTVIGLMIGGMAYTLMHVRLKWQRQDLYILSKRAEEKLMGTSIQTR